MFLCNDLTHLPCSALTTVTACRPLNVRCLSCTQEKDAKLSAGKEKPSSLIWVNLADRWKEEVVE